MTFTKEQLIQTANAEIAEWSIALERSPDNPKYQQWLKLARIALTSLEAEPVGEFYHEARWGWYEISEGDSVPERARIPLYRVPPAPVVPDALYQFAEFMAAESIKSGDYPDGWQCKASNAAHEYAQACRAAMLQGK